jgi:methionine-rich copper-binding protein CopC
VAGIPLRVSLLCGAAAVVVGAAPAFGHAAYRESDPARGVTVTVAPPRVSADFTEPLTRDSTLQVVDPCGRRVDGDSDVDGERVTVDMSGDAAGTYQVRFRLISTVDGHPTRGGFVFTAQQGAACPQGAGGAAGSTDENGLLEGIPLDGAIVAYLIAAAIGGAGGFVYSRIVRPD